ncbi:unnamed protein product [Rangifer tarandus platyrhynchus]|uniref:Uncharacterized protein n=2 Tax=Rangifer tarandus platyrhynchus TaxID=3082113 RepID=A0ABN8ZRU1_RANTA|nr:unnamed protein product [Rangifer tarandus platyrhynchus]
MRARAHTHTHTHVHSQSYTETHVLCGPSSSLQRSPEGAALGFWLQPSCLAGSFLLSLPKPNCCYFVPGQGGGNCSDSRSERQDRVVGHGDGWRETPRPGDQESQRER